MAKQGFLNVFDFMARKAPKEPAVSAPATPEPDSEVPALDLDDEQLPDLEPVSDDEGEAEDEEDEADDDNDNEKVQVKEPLADCMDPVNLAHVRLRELLEGINDHSPETGADRVLNQLNYTNFPALRRAAASLNVKGKDKKLDVVFRARITAMAGVLNLYLDPELSYTWRQASMIVAKSQDHGVYRARSLRSWLHAFLTSKKLPLHRYGQYHSSILNDEDFSDAIKLHLQSISRTEGHFRAQDLVDFVASSDMQTMLDEAGIHKRSISVRTARRWLKQLDWRYGRRKNGMYVDGHEREDVVAYRAAFVKRWLEQYEPRMVVYDNDGKVIKNPEGYAHHAWLVQGNGGDYSRARVMA
ncbi:hypothetical protein C8R46DRAFT_1014739 [Mycena filopes]|nr:hypothetical protein C8R46DRAFT_1014739 [Mycena filopes]